jgi:hypoxanthine phosphoribosyltransferase
MKVYENFNISTVFSESLIQKRISEVALQISENFKNKEILVVAVLNGSFIFCADLVRKINLKIVVDFVSLSSYCGMKSQCKVNVVSGLKESVEDKNVLIIEDIVDTGVTLDFLIREISFKNPKNIKTCVLLNKKVIRKKNVSVDYSCFEVDNSFVVGYGLDYDGLFRGLPYIGKIEGSLSNE